MSALDLESLLQDLSADAPCGENLEYDAGFASMERASTGKPEQQMGGAVIPAEEPDWRNVQEICLDLFKRTRDLRVAVTLARAQLGLGGVPGFADGIALVRGLVERQWSAVHPQLDPSDHNDPIMRVNAVASLGGQDTVIRSLRMTPLVASRALGRFGLRDVEIAAGTAPAPGGDTPPPDTATIDGAFMDADEGELKAVAEALGRAITDLDGLDKSLNTAIGSAPGPDLSTLKTTLKAMDRVMREQLARRGGDELAGEEGEAAAGGGEGGGGKTKRAGEISSREDVVRALDKICDYYARHEPSSPLPILLQRAKRLVSKTFVEIIRDLAPGGASEVETIAGLDRQE